MHHLLDGGPTSNLGGWPWAAYPRRSRRRRRRSIGLDYPQPVVGHADARLRALALFRALAPGRPLG